MGLSEVDAKQMAASEGFELGSVRSYFKANSKALAELESDGLMKLLFNKSNGEVLGAHIYGLHAADLIQEVANAARQSVSQLSTEVHTHPQRSGGSGLQASCRSAGGLIRRFFLSFNATYPLLHGVPSPSPESSARGASQYAVPHDDEAPAHSREDCLGEGQGG